MSGMQTALSAINRHLGNSPFTQEQAQAAGVSRQQLSRLLRHGLVRTVLYGVYQVGDGALEPSDRVKAAALVLPPGSAIARRTAAWLFGIDTRSPNERSAPLDVECVVPRGQMPVRRAGVRCYQTDLEPDDLMSIQGTPCTTPTRTATDLLRWLSPPMGLAGADALAAAGYIDQAEVSAMLERWPGHPFIKQARRLSSWIEPLSESFGETWLRLRILEAGFPRPLAQIPIFDSRGRVVFRLDLGWPERRIGIEYDGVEFHSDRASQLADLKRRERLARQFGWHVVGVGRGEVLGSKLDLERGVGELLGMEPTTLRRTW